MNLPDEHIIQDFRNFIGKEDYPCVAARAALHRDHITALVAVSMANDKDDYAILSFLYQFVEQYRRTQDPWHSAAVIFRSPEVRAINQFEDLLWTRLNALSALDAKKYPFDPRVSSDPSSPDFSFSLGGEAFFVIGMHPESPRPPRRFAYPAIIFNPHEQFEHLREQNRFEKMKNVVRKRDTAYSGSINPMLEDFGTRSEVFQYSGRQYDQKWQCPLHIKHGESDNN